MSNEIASELIKIFEGWSGKVYLCPGGFATVGYGHRCRPDHPDITLERGEEYLKYDLYKAFNQTVKYCPVLILHPLKLAAIADFVFNLGAGRLQTSTLRRRINEQNWDEAVRELKKWIWGGGRKLPGLILRREAEARLIVK